jgi:hypothetical protein
VIEIARPGLLWAGALAALLPLALHLIRPRERERRMLPTARFLTPDTRTRLRLHRRPDHLLLLALRMALCLLLGAALSGLSWVGPSEGTREIVIVDAGPRMAPVWDEVGEALAPLVDAGTTQVVLVGRDDQGQVEYRPLPAEAVPPGEGWDALAPGEGGTTPDVRLAHLLRGLRDAAGLSLGADSLRARVVTLPRWSAWGVGTVELRESLWPGAIALTPIADEAPPAPRSTPAPVRLQGPEELTTAIGLALERLGHEVADVEAPVELRVGGADALGGLWTSDSGEARTSEEGDFLLLDGRVLGGAGPPLPGTPAEGAMVPLLRSGGVPAAASRPEDDQIGNDGEPAAPTCEVALPLEAGAPILESGELALLLEALLREACGPGVGGAGDATRSGTLVAWTQLLDGNGGHEVVEAEPLRYREAGRSLTRLLMALALAVALIEVYRVRLVT